MIDLLYTTQEGSEGIFNKLLTAEVERLGADHALLEERIGEITNAIAEKQEMRGADTGNFDPLNIDIFSIDLDEIHNLSNLNAQINALQRDLEFVQKDQDAITGKLEELNQLRTNLQDSLPQYIENEQNALSYFDNQRITNIRKHLITHLQEGSPIGADFVVFLADQLIEQAVEVNFEKLIASRIQPIHEELESLKNIITTQVLAVRNNNKVLDSEELQLLGEQQVRAKLLSEEIVRTRKEFLYGFENANDWETYVRTTAGAISKQINEIDIESIVEAIPRLALIVNPSDYAELIDFNIPSLSFPELVEILDLDGRDLKEVERIFKLIKPTVTAQGNQIVTLKERYLIDGKQQEVLTKYGIAHFLKELNVIRTEGNDSTRYTNVYGNRGQIRGIGYGHNKSEDDTSEPVSLRLFSLNDEDSLADYIRILNKIEGDATRVKLEGLSLEEDVERTLRIDARQRTAKYKLELPSATRLFKRQPLGVILNPSNLPLPDFFEEAVEKLGIQENLHYMFTETGRYIMKDEGIRQIAKVMINQTNVDFANNIMILCRQAGINPDDFGDDFEELTLVTLKSLERPPQYVPFPTHTAISMALEVDEDDLSNGFLNPRYKYGRQQAAPLLLTSKDDIANPYIIPKAQGLFSNAKSMLHNTNTSGWLIASGEEYAANALYKLSRAYARAAANMDDDMQEYVYGIAHSIENTANTLEASQLGIKTEDFIERILISGANEFQTPQIDAIANAVGDESLNIEKFRIMIASSQLKRTQHFILEPNTEEILLSRTVVNRMRVLIAENERPEGTKVNLLRIFNQIAAENIDEQRVIRKRRSLHVIEQAGETIKPTQPLPAEESYQADLTTVDNQEALELGEDDEEVYEQAVEIEPEIVDWLAIIETGSLQERIEALEIVTESEIRKAAALINRELENLIMYIVEANQEGIPANTGRERAISTIVSTVRGRSKRESNDKWREILVNNNELVEDIANAIYDDYFDHDGKFYSNFSKAITGKIPVHHMLSILDITSLDDREARYLVEDLRKRTVARGKGTQGTNDLNTAEEVFRFLLAERPQNRNLSEEGLTDTLEAMLRYGYHLQPKDLHKQVEQELARFETTKSLSGLAQLTIKQILNNPGKHLTNLSFEQIKTLYEQIPLGFDFKPTREMLHIEIDHFINTRDFASLSTSAKHVVLNNLDKLLANYNNNEIESLFWSLSEDLQKKYQNKFSEFIAEREKYAVEKSESADSDEDSSDDLIIEDDELDDINIFDKIRATINDELDLSHIAEQIDQSLYNSNPYVKNLVQRLVKNPVQVTSRMKRIEIPGQVEFYSYGLKGSSYRIILEQNPNSTYKVVFLGTHRDYEKVILNLKKKL